MKNVHSANLTEYKECLDCWNQGTGSGSGLVKEFESRSLKNE